MTTLDPHYTPTWLARELVAALPESPAGRIIADLAAGRGALLDAAELRFGDAFTYVATDADTATVSWLRRHRTHWKVGRLDVLDSVSRRNSPVYASAHFGAAVLNPPFSCRGQRRHGATLNGRNITASRAVALTIQTLDRMVDGGVVTALLPSNALRAEKDEEAWELVRTRWEIEELARYGDNLFNGVRARVSLVRIRTNSAPVGLPGRANSRDVARSPSADLSARCTCDDVVRGRVSMHDAARRAVGPLAPLIHTTDLQQGMLRTPSTRTARRLASAGPLVLVPRVGAPSTTKIAVSPAAAVLSDCLFGLRPSDPSRVEALRQAVLEAGLSLRDAYAGSCAPYLTVRRLVTLLESIGWQPEPVPADAARSACRCGLAAPAQAAL